LKRFAGWFPFIGSRCPGKHILRKHFFEVIFWVGSYHRQPLSGKTHFAQAVRIDHPWGTKCDFYELQGLSPMFKLFIYYYHCFAMSQLDWPITTKRI
jgi:hypothetical protein